MSTDDTGNGGKPSGDDPVTHDGMKGAALLHVTSAHLQAEAALATLTEMVRAARGFGASWDEVGRAMNISRQVAHRRFSANVA